MDLTAITDCSNSWAPGVTYAWLAHNIVVRKAPARLYPTVFHFWGDASRQPRAFTPGTLVNLWT